MVNMATTAVENNIGVVNLESDRPTWWPNQLRIFTPVGNGDEHCGNRERSDRHRADTGGEHVVGPDTPTHEADR